MQVRYSQARLIFLSLLLLPCGVRAQQQEPPYSLPAGVDRKSDVVYATVAGRDLHIDLFLPASPKSATMPAVLFIHGGGWVNGNRNAFQRQAAYLASKGIAGASMEYRLSPAVTYPAALHDAKAALRWLRANAAKYKIDPSRIAVAGGSAGGQLAGLLGTTMDNPAYEGDEGVTGVSTKVVAMVLFNPVADLVHPRKSGPVQVDSMITKYLGTSPQENPQRAREASPLFQVSAKSAPALVLHGDADNTVPYKQSVEMVEKLKAAGVNAELFTAPGAEHAFFNRPPWYEPTLKRMEEFLVPILKP